MKLHYHDEIIINVSYQKNERHYRDYRFEGSNMLLHILFELIYCFLLWPMLLSHVYPVWSLGRLISRGAVAWCYLTWLKVVHHDLSSCGLGLPIVARLCMWRYELVWPFIQLVPIYVNHYPNKPFFSFFFLGVLCFCVWLLSLESVDYQVKIA